MIRPRNAAATRAAILEAARQAFSVQSFDQVGIRDITRAAGVNGSLVNRYFGTKKHLFAEVMRSEKSFVDIEGHTFDEAVSLLADRALDRAPETPASDPVLALIRSAPVEATHPILRDYLSRKAIAPLATLIGGNCAEERASVVVAMLLGVIIVRSIVKSDPLASTTQNGVADLIEIAIKCVIKVRQMDGSVADSLEAARGS